ncbi:hypothetical protein CHLNCDRAFT_137469 [Chlorella variabilis]|uniref:Uncharacterized protein n=1 Tax=Chlorella variabilis TaxID=554065 RepID=E1ZMI2_CHLVA|nr:hypothetical protein CHLNCDRAFT_137469 [Chlorella variabilis]EFN53118.1 hypothetical protein CHLNCDRAFT_137469 [Chlorella variabilis]|eukprot:XP_005845220.1 hypothetical protein CHLNCDRAFT_137469 [Chlorella variabilis]
MRVAILLCLVAGLLAVPAMARRCQDSCDATTCDHPCSCEFTELRCPGASGGTTGTDCNNPCEFFECLCPPFNVPRDKGRKLMQGATKSPPCKKCNGPRDETSCDCGSCTGRCVNSPQTCQGSKFVCEKERVAGEGAPMGEGRPPWTPAAGNEKAANGAVGVPVQRPELKQTGTAGVVDGSFLVDAEPGLMREP